MKIMLIAKVWSRIMKAYWDESWDNSYATIAWYSELDGDIQMLQPWIDCQDQELASTKELLTEATSSLLYFYGSNKVCD